MNRADTIWESKNDIPRCQMRSFIMQRGPYEEVYYVERNCDTGVDQIVRLENNGEKVPTKSIALKMIGENLIAFNVKVEGQIS